MNFKNWIQRFHGSSNIFLLSPPLVSNFSFLVPSSYHRANLFSRNTISRAAAIFHSTFLFSMNLSYCNGAFYYYSSHDCNFVHTRKWVRRTHASFLARVLRFQRVEPRRSDSVRLARRMSNVDGNIQRLCKGTNGPYKRIPFKNITLGQIDRTRDVLTY